MRFTQIFLAATTAALALSVPTKLKKRGHKLRFFGVNESGAEFGNQNLPGVYGHDYTWYDLSTIPEFINKGMNIFRLNLQMERLVPNSLYGPLDPYYSGNLTEQVNYITSLGAFAMICPHNYGRYYNTIINDTAGFEAFWATVAKPFQNNALVMFDTNNEYHDMPQSLVVDLNQAAINGIRGIGANSQYITPEGNSYTGAWTWISSGNGATMGALKDPQNKLIYQMHQYLDSDGSGTSTTCVNSTIFENRLVAATQWLQQNNKLGIIGEFAGGDNATCLAALEGGLKYLGDNDNVWTGAMWWAAGPWWGDYIFSMEPPSGIAYTDILPKLLPDD
ncbi:hypothetical protein MMC27_001600 [Xylographa pallens]|nr:hypothetical protein [Xylographa pallens]